MTDREAKPKDDAHPFGPHYAAYLRALVAAAWPYRQALPVNRPTPSKEQ